jgi:pSer/pThr/pTyr-binding forkhead associated (FHA) protein
MADRTVLIRRRPQSFAYLFWVGGARRGEHAPLEAGGTTTIGRGEHADVILDDETVSAEQARIRLEQDNWFLYDLAAVNTTEVAGQPVHRRQLEDGDRITFGRTEMVFRVLK